MPFPRSFPLLVAFASGTGSQSQTLNLPFDVRVVAVTATTPANVSTGALNIDVTVAGTSIFAQAADKPTIAVGKSVAQDGSTNANYRVLPTATATVTGSTVAYLQENPTGGLTGKWTSQTPATTASVQGQALAVALSGTYAATSVNVVLELERL